MERATSPRPDWVRHAGLGRLQPATGSAGVVVRGLLVLDHAAPPLLRPRLLVDGEPVQVTWGIRSPAPGKRFPDAANGGRARFRSAPILVRGGLVELVVDNQADDTRVAVASRRLPAPGHPSGRRVDVVRARIDRLSDDRDPDENKDEQMYAALSRTLRRIPEADRDIDWLEARVLADGHFRKHPKATHRRLRQLRDRHRAADTDPAFDAFWQQLARATHPYVLVPHGYRMPFAARDQPEVWRQVARLTEQLAALGYDSFVNSGTLLGVVRDGNLIPHDDDVDLAVILPAETVPDVVRAWNVLKAQLARAGLLRLDHDSASRSHCKLVAAGLSVDLFPAWVSGDRVYVWPHTNGDVATSGLLPLVERQIHGSTVRLPRQPEQFLERNYGPDWRTTDPVFRFDWARARQRFGTFVEEIRRSGD